MPTLRQARRAKLMTLRELAQASGTPVSVIVEIEHGRSTPRLSTIRKLSQALEVDPASIEEFRRTIEEEA